jgi:hypothetical protein
LVNRFETSSTESVSEFKPGPMDFTNYATSYPKVLQLGFCKKRFKTQNGVKFSQAQIFSLGTT